VSKDLRLPHEGLVLVIDGRKALFLKNQGDDVYPNFQIERVLQAPENPPTREQGVDKPGMRGRPGNMVEQTDWHDLAERHFAAEVAEVLNTACFNHPAKAIVVAAPPRTLAELRKHFSDIVKQQIVAEVNKDLTKQPIYDIEQYLAGA
jgi:protein required for attachment to host cells